MTSCKVVLSRGSIYLIGEHVNFIGTKWKSLLAKECIPGAFFENRIRRDGEAYHVTLVDKGTLTALSVKCGKTREAVAEELMASLEGIDLSSFVDVGVGKAADEFGNKAYFVLVSFERLRLRMWRNSSGGGGGGAFHIALAFGPGEDVHSVRKDEISECLIVSPVNDLKHLLPVPGVMEEMKALIRSGKYATALRIHDCIRDSQRTVEIGELRAFILYKLARFQECVDLTRDLLLEAPNKRVAVLLNVRMADAQVSLGDFRGALLPIWRALNLLATEDSLTELKEKVCEHLIEGLLMKCARHGYLRIDCVPVSRKRFHEREGKPIVVEDEFVHEVFAVYREMKDVALRDTSSTYNDTKTYYESILERVTRKYGEICHEQVDENFMPLESRWIAMTTRSGMQVLPRNFSYLWPNLIAVSSTPRHGVDIEALAGLGISLVVTLTEEEPLKAEWFEHLPRIRNLFVPVANYGALSVSAADRIVWEVACETSRQRGGKVLVHCGGGKGRAGTVAGVLLMTLGVDPTRVRVCDGCLQTFRPFGTCGASECSLSGGVPLYEGSVCVSLVRRLRPESLETEQQEAFLRVYSGVLWQRSSALGLRDSFILESFDGDSLEVSGQLPRRNPASLVVVVLSGLPGSGKTTFALALKEKLEASGTTVRHVSQDALGGREAFERVLGGVRPGLCEVVLIDRCNVRATDRSLVLGLLHSPPPSQVLFVSFKVPAALCLQRIDQRFEHETLKPAQGRRAVRHFEALQEPVDRVREGGCAVLTVESIGDSRRAIDLLVKSLGKKGIPVEFKKEEVEEEDDDDEVLKSCNSGDAGDAGIADSSIISGNSTTTERLNNFYKFPRTEHLFNFGGATRDDLVLSPSAFRAFFAPAEGKTITLEEKIDGANVGFTLDAQGRIQCQNRSHYVDSKSHFQFQRLGSFIFQKGDDLRRVLSGGAVLYGEWLFAKHSIHYTALPDLFMAFDIFFPSEQKFLDRASFYAVMESTSIAYVKPLQLSLTDTSPAALEKVLMSTKSAFSDSLIEGIYFRWDQNGRLRTRAKLVRSDFITGNEHWSKGKFTLNTIKTDER